MQQSRDEVKTRDLIVTPPLYLSEPNSENALRVIKVLDNFHNDREKLYYLNVKSIPSSKGEIEADKNTLQFAILSRIKIFVRPPGLERIDELENKLAFKIINNDAIISNPTPYYMIYAELSGDFPLGDSRQPTYKSLRPFDLVS